MDPGGARRVSVAVTKVSWEKVGMSGGDGSDIRAAPADDYSHVMRLPAGFSAEGVSKPLVKHAQTCQSHSPVWAYTACCTPVHRGVPPQQPARVVSRSQSARLSAMIRE